MNVHQITLTTCDQILMLFNVSGQDFNKSHGWDIFSHLQDRLVVLNYVEIVMCILRNTQYQESGQLGLVKLQSGGCKRLYSTSTNSSCKQPRPRGRFPNTDHAFIADTGSSI